MFVVSTLRVGVSYGTRPRSPSRQLLLTWSPHLLCQLTSGGRTVRKMGGDGWDCLVVNDSPVRAGTHVFKCVCKRDLGGRLEGSQATAAHVPLRFNGCASGGLAVVQRLRCVAGAWRQRTPYVTLMPGPVAGPPSGFD